MGFLSLIGSFFSFISGLLTGRREDKLRREGKTEAQKEFLEAVVVDIKKREEAINAQPKTSYDGDPSLLREWLHKRNNPPK